MEKIYDMLIIGGGPGGYTAALYAARGGLHTALVERMAPGGQMALSTQIDNYPGFPQGVDGYHLAEEMRRGAERFGAETVLAQVRSIEPEGEVKQVHTDGGVLKARTLVIATGADPRKLGLDQEEALVGQGISYCAHCDGRFFAGKTVAVVGGGNSAVGDALLLSRMAQKVYLIHRRQQLRADRAEQLALEKAENVEFLPQTQVVGLIREGRLTALELEDRDGRRELAVQGLFVSIGREPATDLVKGKLALDDSGYILADETTRTSIPGVYAVGDVRSKALRQIVTATADGANAAHFAQEYLF